MDAQLEGLVDDGTLVAEAGARLGALKDDALLKALTAAKQAPTDGAADPALVENLRRALNGAIRDIAPVTLRDLRDGWRPHQSQRGRRPVKLFFFLVSVALMAACAYTTQVYERARSTYATMLELQDARGAEQAMRLFGMLKRNQEDVVASLKTGKKEFLYDVFSKALFDLKAMYVKNIAYAPLASSVLNDLEMIASPSEALRRLRNPMNPSNDEAVQKWVTQPGYGPTPPQGGAVDPLAAMSIVAAALPADDPKREVDVQKLLENYLEQLRRFNHSINVYIDPLQPQDYSQILFALRNGIGFVGAWVLPALYGMLGAIVFYMRSLLNPLVPDPSSVRIIFRVMLGGFAGIIVVWFWTPTSQKTSQGEFVTLTSFGIAFLVGFSTDIFFGALDRLVDYGTRAISGIGGSGGKGAAA